MENCEFRNNSPLKQLISATRMQHKLKKTKVNETLQHIYVFSK